MFMRPVSSWAVVVSHGVLLHLLSSFLTVVFFLLSFNVGVVFNHTFYFSPPSPTVSSRSFLSLHHMEKQHLFPHLLQTFFGIQFTLTAHKNTYRTPSFTHNSCKPEHVFKVAILRYVLAETPVYKPSLQGYEPVFHTCQTKLISARSSFFLSDTCEIQQEEQRLLGF